MYKARILKGQKDPDYRLQNSSQGIGCRLHQEIHLSSMKGIVTVVIVISIYRHTRKMRLVLDRKKINLQSSHEMFSRGSS